MWDKFTLDLANLIQDNWNVKLNSNGLWKKYPWKLLEFLSRLEVHYDGCWLFKETNKDGYGRFNWQLEGESYLGGHRVAFVLFNGHIKDQIGVMRSHSDLVCHDINCIAKACVHPQHLRLGTSQNNIQDAILKGTHASIFKDNSGENNPAAKLNEATVRQIKRRLAVNLETLQTIADDFNVSQSTIHGIKQGKIWPNVLIEDVP